MMRNIIKSNSLEAIKEILPLASKCNNRILINSYNLALIFFIISLYGCHTPSKKNVNFTDEFENQSGKRIGQKESAQDIRIPKGVTIENGINQNEAISIALWNNTEFQSAISNLGYSRANLIQAEHLTNPTFSLLFPVGSKQLELNALIPLEAIWLRPSRIKIAEGEYKRDAQLLIQHGLNVIRDVRVAYLEVILAADLLSQQMESTLFLKQIVDLSKIRLREGDISASKYNKLLQDYQNANNNLNQLEKANSVRNEELRKLIGFSTWKEEFLTISDISLQEVDSKLDTLIEVGLASRPDLRAAEIEIELAGQKLGLTKSEIHRITGIIDINGGGDGKSFEIGPGLSFEIPIFHQNQGKVLKNQTALDKALRNYVDVKDNIITDIRIAWVNYTKIREEFNYWNNKIIPTNRKIINDTNAAHEAGNISLIDVFQQQISFIQSQIEANRVYTNLNISLAELERSIGIQLNKITSTTISSIN